MTASLCQTSAVQPVQGGRQALGNLAKNKDITILPADNGKATVIMDTEDYELKVKEMLDDKRTYEVLKSDPTLKYKKELVGKLSRLKQEGKITQADYGWLYPTAENVPRMYCTPKIHKTGNPLRPIVDYTSSIGYRTSRALADILAPLVGKSDHHLNNSKHLAKEMMSVMAEEDEMFISYDVVSLFTNTPIHLALQVIRERLEGDMELHTRTRFTIEDIMDLLMFIVTTTYFSFRGVIHQQMFGAAMGSPVSLLLANLFMEWLEKHAIATAPVECKPKFWKRYVDDVLELIKKGQVRNLTDHINTTDPTGNIKFTYEEEEDKQIPFLDTLLV